jgi:hypothetical protein
MADVNRRRGRGQWAAAGLLLLIAAGASAQEPCLKPVFGRFCLGGDLDTVLRQSPQPLIQQSDGERRALVYQEGPERVYVLAFRNAIYKVVRRYRAATQLRYEELYQVLRGKYGPGEDRSHFAASADTAGRRQAAIRRGEGRAVHHWKAAEDWEVELSWTREMGLSLAYIATALDARQQAVAEQGL